MSPPTVDSTKDFDKKPSQRKTNKPLIEKRRRARINECLSQLKTIVLSASESKSPRPSKLEKADILEMTVEFVKNRLSSENVKTEENGNKDSHSEYFAGYSKCLNEISKFLEHTRPLNSSLKQDIVDHVSGKLKGQLSSPEQTDEDETNAHILPNTDSMTSEEAIDLTLRNKEPNEADTSDGSKQTSVSQRQPSITVTGIQNTSTPVGLVCGGQVMFLVQIPQAITSQTMQTPNMTSFPINQSHSIPATDTSYPVANHVYSQLMTYPSSQSQNNMPMFGVQTSLTSAQVPTEVLNTHARVIFSASESTVEPIRIEQNNAQNLSHWRPW